MKMVWPPPSGTVALSADAVDVWAVRLDEADGRMSKLAAVLSSAERQRAQQFQLEEPRRRFIHTRVALRMLLGSYLGMPPERVLLETEPGGKPRLTAPLRASGLHFSVAHSADVALIAATAGCEVGVDVEGVRAVRHAEQIARRFFHPAEAQAILAAEPAERDAAFLRSWTGKEAVLKAVGSGITDLLDLFQVSAHEVAAAWVELPPKIAEKNTRCWLQRLAPCPTYVGAVACLGGARRLRRFLFDW